MKKVLFLSLIVLITIVACDNDSSSIEISNELKEKITKYYGGYTGANENYLTDSVTEFYENKLLVKKNNWYFLSQGRILNTTSFYTYDNNNLLIEKKVFDTDNNILRADLYYEYDSNLNIIKIRNKIEGVPNFIRSYNTTIVFNYKADTIKKVVLDSIENTSIVTNYLTSNNVITKSNINSDFPTSYIYDNESNLITSANSDTDRLFSNENVYSYGDNREPLIRNMFGTIRNYFLISGYSLELGTKYLQKIEYIHAFRNGNYNDYIYTFDNENRLIEIKTNGSFLAYTIINYIYN